MEFTPLTPDLGAVIIRPFYSKEVVVKGLKLFLFVSFIVALISGLAYLLLPPQMADAKMGPQDAPSARYFGVTFIGLSGAAWYGFRHPKKNVAVGRAIITLWVSGGP